MGTITDIVFEELARDIVSHGLFAQLVKLNKSEDEESRLGWEGVLKQLLLSERVELGTAISATNNYVKFVAWRGTIEERVTRAVEQVKSQHGPAQEFAYWLCLKENIDHYEDEE